MALRIVTASANIPRDNHWVIPSGSSTPVRTLLLEHGRNQPIYSNDFSNAVYTKENATVTGSVSGVIAPDGTETAWILRETTTTGVHGLVRESAIGSNSNWGLGVFVKVFNTRTHARLYVWGDSGTPGFVHFNLNDTGSFTITNNSATITSARMEDYGNGWWRLSAFWRIPAFGTQQGYLRVCRDASTVSYAGDTSEGLYVWGWNDQSLAGTNTIIGTPNSPVASYISSSAVTGSRHADQMRFNGQTGTPQESTIYVRGVAVSFASKVGLIILLGNNELPYVKAGIRHAANGQVQAFFDAEGSAAEVVSTTANTSLLTPGNQVELMMHMSGSKQVQLFHTLNGGSVVSSSVSSVSTGLFPPAQWGSSLTPNNLFLAQGTDSAPGVSFAYQNVLIAKGIKTMQEMRALAGVTTP